MKKIIALAMALIMALSLVACGNGGGNETQNPDGESKGLVGYVAVTMAVDFLKNMAETNGALWEEAGYTYQIVNGDGKAENQVIGIENLVAMGAKLIYVQPISVEALEAAVASAREQGVKVCFVGNPPTYDCDGMFITDEAAVGQMLGEMAMKWVDDTFPDAEAGSVKVAVMGDSTAATSILRMDTALAVLKADPRITIVYEDNRSLDTNAAMESTTQALAIDREINLWLGFDADRAIACNSVLTAEQGLDLSKVCVMAGSCDSAASELIEQSKTGGSVLRGAVLYGNEDLATVSLFPNGMKIMTGEITEPNTVFGAMLIPVAGFDYEG